MYGINIVRRTHIIVAICAITAGSSSAVQAGVVFGNLGSSGSGVLSNTGTDVGAGQSFYVAQGFTAAAPNLTVDSISLGLFGTSVGSVVVTVGIYADAFGLPANAPLYFSTAAVGGKNVYAFDFTNQNASLTAGNNYWIIPDSETSVTWYLNDPGSAPSGQNSSGYAYTDTFSKQTGFFWTTAASNQYSVSINAVPEPSTYAMALAGLACGGYTMFRRRKRA